MFIAEIGINANGDISIALQLIEQAKAAGADVVKFQKRNVEKCYPKETLDEVKDTIFGRMTYREYKNKLEFEKQEYNIIDYHCRKLGISWTASIWDVDSLEFLMGYEIPFIKIPSARTLDYDLLDAVNRYRKPVIISMGATTEEEMKCALQHLHSCEVSILHCNASYPAREQELNLSYIQRLKWLFSENRIGYSGHEEGYFPTLMAKTLGAEIIERHITLDKSMPGSDQKASLSIEELKELIPKLKWIDVMLGSGTKIIYDSEAAVMKKLRLE